MSSPMMARAEAARGHLRAVPRGRRRGHRARVRRRAVLRKHKVRALGHLRDGVALLARGKFVEGHWYESLLVAEVDIENVPLGVGGVVAERYVISFCRRSR